MTMMRKSVKIHDVDDDVDDVDDDDEKIFDSLQEEERLPPDCSALLQRSRLSPASIITLHHPLNVNHNYYYFYRNSENVYMVVIIMRGSIDDSFTAFVTYTAKERTKMFHCTPQMHPCPR